MKKKPHVVARAGKRPNSSPAEEDPVVTVGIMFNMSRQYTVSAIKAHHVLSCDPANNCDQDRDRSYYQPSTQYSWGNIYNTSRFGAQVEKRRREIGDSSAENY